MIKPINLKKLFRFLGIFLIIFPSIVVSILAIVFSSLGSEHNHYDFEKIKSKGAMVSATIIGVEEKDNISINDVHPIMFSYDYKIDGQSKTDKFEALANTTLRNINVGDKVDVLYCDGESMFKGFHPVEYNLSIAIYLIPIIFSVIGIVFLFVAKKSDSLPN
jgi:hypothetical protein